MKIVLPSVTLYFNSLVTRCYTFRGDEPARLFVFGFVSGSFVVGMHRVESRIVRRINLAGENSRVCEMRKSSPCLALRVIIKFNVFRM